MAASDEKGDRQTLHDVSRDNFLAGSGAVAPMAAVAEELSLGTLWIISAPSGAGKTTLTKALIHRLHSEGIEAAFSVSYTTRPPRADEVDGVDYHFVDTRKFSGMTESGELIEHAEVFGHNYGTGRAATLGQLQSGQEVFLDIDWQGARKLRSRIPETRSVFILPPTEQELEKRLRQRSQDKDCAIAERMRNARAEMSHYFEYDALVVNTEFNRALEELYALVIAHRLRCQRQKHIHADLIRQLVGHV